MATLSCRRSTRLIFRAVVLLTLAACSASPRDKTFTTVSDWTLPTKLPTQAEKEAAEELLDMFREPCLERFPDDSAVESYAKEKNLTPMTEAEIRHLLGTDPGEGWIGQASSRKYLLTVEKPPYHTCAIRRLYTIPPTAVASLYYLDLVVWAAASRHGTMTQQPPKSMEMEGRPTHVYVYFLRDPDGMTREDFLLFVTDLSDGTYAIRLARQILRQPFR
jgi:hypothetical protein